MNDNKTCILISVPFARNARFLLSSKIYADIKLRFRVLIVTHYTVTDQFKDEFGGDNVFFYEIQEKPMSKFVQRLYHFSELLRNNGYRFKHRNAKLAYYWYQAKNISFNKLNGAQKAKIKTKILAYFSGWIGYLEFSWRVLDYVISPFVFNIGKMIDICNPSNRLVIIQTANFGYQERTLSYLSRKLKAKKILFPYTTDQLSVNGYLLNKYDYVCSQGEVDTKYLVDHHKIDQSKVIKLGSIWYRNIENIYRSNNQFADKSSERKILYAGISSQYFSKAGELEVIDEFLHAIQSGKMGNARIIYRPVCTEDELKKINAIYCNNPNIDIQVPELSMIGMNTNHDARTDDSINSYLNMMSRNDIFIMSQITTMLFDAVYFDIPVISYIYDKNNNDLKRNDLYVATDIANIYLSGIPTVRNDPSGLVTLALNYLEDRIDQVQTKQKIIDYWDYSDDKYDDTFSNLLS
jgi:hypothetical protein